MFYHNIDPVLLKIGAFEIRYYGLIFVLSFIIGYFFLVYLAKERKLSLTKEDVSDLLLYLIIGIVFGARLFYILFYNFGYYLENPFEMLALWRGGLSFHGGLVGGTVAALLFCRKKKIHFYEVLDIIVVPAALGLAFGRIAIFLNGELYGRVTNVPWAVDFGDGRARHPSQIYESLKNFFIFGVLWFLRNKKLPRGFLFWSFVTMYSFLRFFIEFVREPDPQLGFLIFNLTMGQILSSVMFVIGIYFLVRLKNSKKSD